MIGTPTLYCALLECHSPFFSALSNFPVKRTGLWPAAYFIRWVALGVKLNPLIFFLPIAYPQIALARGSVKMDGGSAAIFLWIVGFRLYAVLCGT